MAEVEHHHSDNAILTRGLRRVFLCLCIVGVTLATVQLVAVHKLQREIDRWAWTSEMNGLRERLFLQTKDHLGGYNGVSLSEVVTSFDALRDAIVRYSPHSEQAVYVARVGNLEARARALFQQSEELRVAVVPMRKTIFASIEALQAISAAWETQRSAAEQAAVRQYEQINAEIRDTSERSTLLLSVLNTAQLLQQQIIAIERLRTASDEKILLSSIATLDIAGLPAACAPGAPETANRLCTPNSKRFRTAVERLKNSEPEAIAGNIRRTVRALEAYIRAGQGRVNALAAENKETTISARAVRRRMADIQDLAVALNKADRDLFELETQLNKQTPTAASLAVVSNQIEYHTAQIRVQMSGLLDRTPVLTGEPGTIFSATTLISENWTAARDATEKRIALLGAFERTMETLSAEVATHAEKVRNETTLWVNVYVSNFVVLLGLFVAFLGGLFWLARRRFITPLAQVTGHVLGLARGQLDTPVALHERAFGFNTVGQALEQLRLEMKERHHLAKRNEEQQKIIESSLADLRQTSNEMEWMAMHDPLTGLGNRRQADQDLEALTQTHTSRRTDFCVMQIDIDRFKAINDALGHTAGDFVLSTVSNILLTSVAPEAQCYRTGGDEFLLVWSGEVAKDHAASIARSLITQIKEPIIFEGQKCNVGASIGIAYGSDTEFDAARAVVNADIALYEVKRAGRDGFKFFTEDLASHSLRHNDVSDRLINAIEQKLFQPFYQPQFHAQTRKLRGVEVLCRWHDDALGWISAAEFLKIAEDLNAVGKIDEILFEKVTADLHELAKCKTPVPRVSFNITVDRLLQPGLARDLADKIGGQTNVALEFLESISLDNPTDAINHAIDELKEHGIEIEIDDFGSDRASLVGLMAVNPQAMKIDRDIVIPITQSPRHKDLVKKIIDIAAALNIEVVAEGVETEEHAQQLTALGCNVLQGFGLAKPMPFADLVVFCNRGAPDQNDPQAVA